MRRRRRTPVLFRVLPGASPVSRMWAGTKLSALAVITVAVIAIPGWGAVGALAGVVLLTALVARVPTSVVPEPPMPLVVLLALGGVSAFLGGGLALYAQSILIAFGVVALGLLVTWTTPPDQLGSAIAVLMSPLSRLGAPAGLWAATTALAVRSLPLILDDLGTILAVHRLRRPIGPTSRSPGRRMVQLLREARDVSIAAVSVSARRGRDVAAAVATRGGVRPLTARVPRLRIGDLAAAAIAALVVAASIAWR